MNIYPVDGRYAIVDNDIGHDKSNGVNMAKRGGSRPGAGRKPKGEIKGQAAWLSTRLAPDTRAKLEEAAKASGRSLSQEVGMRLRQSFGIQAEDDPYLRGLFYYFGQIAARLSADWRSDPYERQVFKWAITQALNRFVPEEEVVPPQWAEDRHPASFAKMVEWSVFVFMEAAPPIEEVPAGHGLASGSFMYAMPQARAALGLEFDRSKSNFHLHNLAELFKPAKE